MTRSRTNICGNPRLLPDRPAVSSGPIKIERGGGTRVGLFLAECYSLDVSARSVRELRAKADGAAAGLDTQVRCLDVMLIPDDGVVFMVFQGPTVEDVRTSMRAAGFAPDRVVGMIRADEPTRRADDEMRMDGEAPR